MLRKTVWLGVISWLLMVLASPLLGLAQNDPVEMVQYINENAGIIADVPANWTETTGGVFVGENVEADLAALEVTVLPPLPLPDLLQVYADALELDAFPQPLESYDSKFHTWTIYTFDGVVQGLDVRVDAALSETDAGILWVGLYVSGDAYEALHETVFWPVVDSMRVLPDDMRAPVPYEQEIVSFHSVGDVVLTGTLSLPPTEGPHPAVVLISGSGAQDRDESLKPATSLKPFRLIADRLTNEGFAVLRYDDRGVGQSFGDHNAATTADFADDAEAALSYLLTRDEIDPAQIGLFGHSEGGIIAAMVAARNNNVAFVINMAGPSVDGVQILILQSRLILEASGLPETVIDEQIAIAEQTYAFVIAGDIEGLEAYIREQIDKQAPLLPQDQKDELVTQEITTINSPWFQFFLTHDPGENWEQVTVPVLSIFGGLDLQVDAEQNAGPLAEALEVAGNDDVTIITLDKANHLFQTAVTGNPDEYGTLEQDFMPEFLDTVTEWLLARVDT